MDQDDRSLDTLVNQTVSRFIEVDFIKLVSRKFLVLHTRETREFPKS